MKPPEFTTLEEADAWLRQQALVIEWTTGRRRLWLTEVVGGEGVIVSYNTTSTNTGGFIVLTYRTDGYGGIAEVLYARRFARRKLARDYALKQFGKYSPKWKRRWEARRATEPDAEG